jgi:hypothetical protein
MYRSFAVVAGLVGITLSPQMAQAPPAHVAALNISTDVTQNVACTGGVCTPTGRPATLNVTDLANMLAGGDIVVKAKSLVFDIYVAAPLTWASSHVLTLDTTFGIIFAQPVMVEGTAGLVLITDDGGFRCGCDFSFAGNGNIAFWDLASKLTINGKTYTLVNDLATLATDISIKPKGRYALANDYDAGPDGTYTDSPITTALTGTFEGLGHTISNLTINASNVDNPIDTVGLFASARTLRDIALANANVTVTADADGAASGFCAGLLVGKTDAGSSISNVSVSGNVTAQRGAAAAVISAQIGGLSCGGGGKITNARAVGGTLTVNNFDFAIVGGLVGINDAKLGKSYASMNITAHAVGNGVQGAGAVIGGLVSMNHGTIDVAYATGSVAADAQAQKSGTRAAIHAGGLVGNYDSNGDTNEISDVYATGSVQGEASGSADSYARVGGLVGFYDGSGGSTMVADAYSTGAVSGSSPGSLYLGGLVGDVNDMSSVFSNTYWDLDTSNISDPSQGVGGAPNYSGITGKTTSQLQSGLPTGFAPQIWDEKKKINGGLPYLRALPTQ